MKRQINALHVIHQFPPWLLHGEAFILNYWMSPSFIAAHKSFGLAPSPIGRVVQVMLVRYKESPIGPYDELLLMDHPLISKRLLSTIPKIFVSTQRSVEHGQKFWGIPKQHADFIWQQQDDHLNCKITFGNQTLSIDLYKAKQARHIYMNSHHIPSAMLRIRQDWHGQRFQFSPQFRAKIAKIKKAHWHSSAIFPDFSQAKYLHSFYIPEFQLIFPQAKITALKKGVSRETPFIRIRA